MITRCLHNEYVGWFITAEQQKVHYSNEFQFNWLNQYTLHLSGAHNSGRRMQSCKQPLDAVFTGYVTMFTHNYDKLLYVQICRYHSV